MKCSLLTLLLFWFNGFATQALLNQPTITNITYDTSDTKTTRMVIEVSGVEYGMFLYVWRSQTAMDLGNPTRSVLMQVFVVPDTVTYCSYLTEESQGYFWVGVSQLTPFPF